MSYPTQSFQVAGLRCGGCVKRLRQQIEDSSGATDIAIDLPTGECSVSGSTVAPSKLLAALSAAGYSVSERP